MSQNNKDKQKNFSRRDFVKGAGAGAAAMLGSSAVPSANAQSGNIPEAYNHPGNWDLEADIVIIGSGPTGLVAANRALDAGRSVIIVDANYDVGGHGLMNGGQIHLGGGTAMQKKYGVEDSPDTLFKDLTDWSVLETNGMPDYRYNDRGVQRALADNEAATFDYLVENGVEFVDMKPATAGGHAVGISAPRGHYAIWTKGQSAESPRGGGGTAIYRALELSARSKGARILLNYHMDVIYREQPNKGRVLGVMANYTPRYLPGETTPMKSFHSKGNIDMTQAKVTVKAKRSIVIGTGGSTGNLNFRRIFDPRMTEEYQLAGSPFSDQDASGEMAAMSIGASLWGTANQSMERNGYFRKRPVIGCQYTYIEWTPNSILFPFVRATGLKVRSFQNLVIVNQMGKRFYNELGVNWPYGTHHGDLDPYVQGDWRNVMRRPIKPDNWLDAALAPNEGSQPPDYGAGPVWSIFDSEAVKREKWDPSPPSIDPLYFFSDDTLEGLARKIKKNPYQKVNMPPDNLAATIKRYNEIVDFGYDPDFERPNPRYKLDSPPYYAAWTTPVIHDTYAGLRINMKCQVMDMNGEVIQGLYCGGESAGGCSQHGQGRCVTQGFIIGPNAAKESSWG
jgi:hypothetical protein